MVSRGTLSRYALSTRCVPQLLGRYSTRTVVGIITPTASLATARRCSVSAVTPQAAAPSVAPECRAEPARASAALPPAPCPGSRASRVAGRLVEGSAARPASSTPCTSRHQRTARRGGCAPRPLCYRAARNRRLLPPRGRGGTGRRAGFRFQYRKMWGFESLRPHQYGPRVRAGGVPSHSIPT
jgi:hypothetical protein